MRRWLAIVALTACGARSGPSAERRAVPGRRCAAHAWAIVDPSPLVAVPPPAHHTCVRCASREDVLVAIDVPPDRPPFAPADPDAWRCMQRCYADYQCKVGRCVSGWFDPHCAEPGRRAIFDDELPATRR